MSSRVPSSPSLSPGRSLFRSIPQSPALGCRATSGAVLGQVTAASALATSRHAKSTSDLGLARQSRYDPARLALGPARPVPGVSMVGVAPPQARSAASPPPRATTSVRPTSGCPPQGRGVSPSTARAMSPRAEMPGWMPHNPCAAVSRQCTPYALTQVNGNSANLSSPGSGVSTPPPPWRQARGSVGPAIGLPQQQLQNATTPQPHRATSTEGRPGPWAAPASHGWASRGAAGCSPVPAAAETGSSLRAPPTVAVSTGIGAATAASTAAGVQANTGITTVQQQQQQQQQPHRGGQVRPWAMGNGLARLSPRVQSAGAPSQSGVVPQEISRQRSWSQSRQAVRTDALSPRVPPSQAAAQPTQATTDKPINGLHGSPRQQTITQRATSLSYLGPGTIPAGSSCPAGTAGVANTVGSAIAMPMQQYDSVQAVHVRDSLLQHIQSVQKEITRLQTERERNQRNSTVMMACSPRLSLRACLQSPERVCHSFAWAPDSNEAGKEPSSILGGTRTSSRLEPTTAATTEKTVGSTRSTSPAAVVPSSLQVAAATKIQRRWRRGVAVGSGTERCSVQEHVHGTPRRNKTVRCVKGDKPQQKFVAFHYAASRIQRVWKLNRWRRQFVSFSAHTVGWVGSLEWLQQRNMLYGTELADQEDVRWWKQNRATAPLDREVDPWGCTKLRDHLNRMWYGMSTEELQARFEEVEREQQQLEQQEREREDHCGVGTTSQDGITLHEAGQPQRASSSGACQGRPVLLTSYAQQWTASSCNLGVPSSIRSSPRTERAATAHKSVGLVGASFADASKAVSLSPRRESRWLKSDVPASQHQGRCLVRTAGAAPPPVQAFCSPQQTHRVPLVNSTAAVVAALRLPTQNAGQRSGSCVTGAIANQDSCRRGGRWPISGGSGRPSNPIAAAWQPTASSASLSRLASLQPAAAA